MSTGALYTLYQSTHYGSLEPGDVYSVEVISTVLPSYPTGSYTLTAHTDYENDVFEYDADDNNELSKMIYIEQQLADLFVSGVDISIQTTVAGNTMQIRYIVTNIGLGPTVAASWVDQIRVSHSQLFSHVNSRVLIEQVQSQELLAGDSANKTLMVDVPKDVFGQVFLHIHTDSNLRIVEENEGNNEHTSGPFSVAAVFPDLEVQELFVENGIDLQAGDEVQVNWTISNIGNGALEQTMWTDELFLSALPVLTPTAVKLGSFLLDASLQPEESYNQSVDIVMPLDYAGLYYLFVNVNGNGGVDENGAVDNNQAGLQLYLSTPPSPDLTIETIDYNYIGSARILTVEWTGMNKGNGMKMDEMWSDQVFIYEDQTFVHLSAIRLGEVQVSLRLDSFQTYSITQSFSLPETVQGNYYIYVQADSSNEVMEVLGEGNNVERSIYPVNIPEPPSINLQVQFDVSSLPTPLIGGQKVEIEYEVVNVGLASVSTTSWTDGIFLTPENDAYLNSLLDDAILLGQILVNNQLLDPGDSYTIRANVSIPHGISQMLSLAIFVDINGDLGEASYIPPSSLPPVVIEEGPRPDLLALAPSITVTFTGGQPVLVSSQVINVGENAAVSIWYDAIYLSIDAILDPFDTRLKTVQNAMQLEVNQTYNQTTEVFVPFDLPSGLYYLFFQADVDGRVFEVSEENNLDYQLVEIRETVSTDITIARVTASPTELDYGDGEFCACVLCHIYDAKSAKYDNTYMLTPNYLLFFLMQY